MKKIFVDAYISGNLGDDLFLKTLFERYPDTKFFIKGNNKYKETFKEFENVNIKTTPLTYKALNLILRFMYKVLKINGEKKYFGKKLKAINYDGYVKIGGSIFIDNDGKHFEKNKKDITSFVSRKKPVFILGCNFETNHNRKLFENYFDFFSQINRDFFDICFRDKYSYNLFSECPTVRYAPDILFGTEKKQNTKSMIGISLIDLNNRSSLNKFQNQYENKICEIIDKSIEEGKEVALFSFCSKEGDPQIIKRVLQKVNIEKRSKVKVYKYEYNIDKFLNHFSECETIVATRFHAMILGWVYGKKVIPLTYSDKMTNVISDLEFPGKHISIKEISDFKASWLEEKAILDVKKLAAASQSHFIKLDQFLERNN